MLLIEEIPELLLLMSELLVEMLDSTLEILPNVRVPSISVLPEISKVAASNSPVIVIFLPPLISLLASETIALFAETVPFVIPSIRLMSVALAVTPSRIFSSAVVDVTPSSKFNSAVVEVTPSSKFISVAVAVTPSRILSSAAVLVTVVPFIESASVSKVPSISASLRMDTVPEVWPKDRSPDEKSPYKRFLSALLSSS